MKKTKKQFNLKSIKKEQADNRRKLLSSLKPDVRAFAAREFAKLGLYQ